MWAQERERGLTADIDEVIHFLFDDHDFDEGEIGRSLRSEDEVRAIEALKQVLGELCDLHPDGGDDDFVGHPRWSEVRRLALEARTRLDANDLN